jgi:hypothetical protein
VPPVVIVPGSLPVTVTTGPAAPDAELAGFVVLTRGTERRRIPYWLRTASPMLARAKTVRLAQPGAYRATTRGGSSLVSRYRYPESPSGLGFATELAGPERVYRVTLARPAANFGVVVTSRAKGVRVEPRVVRAGDENRLTGYPALPFNLNPYLRTFQRPVLAAGAIRPARGAYDVVFDSPGPGTAGAFTFRFWLNDLTPPTLKLRMRTVKQGSALLLTATDAASGVDPSSLVVRVDGQDPGARFARGVVSIPGGGLRKGRHALTLQLSDYQETRNMENVGQILPNTRVLRTNFVVR